MPTGMRSLTMTREVGYSRFLEEFAYQMTLIPSENESFSLDHFDDLSLSRPPPEPPDVEICFNFEPDTGIVTKKVVGDISEHDVLMPNLLAPPTLFQCLTLFLTVIVRKRGQSVQTWIP
ncbi:hypothetical protein Tco_1404020 [Tanacetum coccineum]